LQININSINCNIDIYSNGKINDQIGLNVYSLSIIQTNKDIIVKPRIDVIEGQFKEDYRFKVCPIIINSYYIKDNIQQGLIIKNNEENVFYLNPQYIIIYLKSLIKLGKYKIIVLFLYILNLKKLPF